MSLSMKQKQDTIQEFQENLDLLQYPLTRIANELNTSVTYLNKVILLQADCLEDPWILKNYICRELHHQGLEETSFRALAGNYHNYWFLNKQKIDKGVIGRK